LTENLTGRRTLPFTQHELQTQLETKKAKKIKRQQAAAKAATNHAAAKQSEADKRVHEAAMAAHLAQQAMAATLASEAKIEDAIRYWQQRWERKD
jgi:hypothetical protein